MPEPIQPPNPSTPQQSSAQPQSPQTKPPKTPPPEPEYGHIPLSEEMDRAKWTLPPMQIVLIALLIVVIVLGAVAWFGRYKAVGAGSITSLYASQAPNQDTTLVVVQFDVRNTSKKTVYVKSIDAKLNAGGQTLDDTAASSTDYERYFTAMPDLRQHADKPLLPETKIAPGQQVHGTAIFGFPVNKQQFDQRQSFVVAVTPYDQRPFELTETKSATQ